MTTRHRQEKELKAYYAREFPPAGGALPRVDLRAGRQTDHPWIFRRMLQGPYANLEPGTLVEAYGRDGQFVGRGFYNRHSEIALRLLSTNPNEPVDGAWFRRAVGRAVALRHEVLRLPERTDAYRVVHSEGDGLSGLVVDRYAGVLVVELFSAGMHRHLHWVKAALEEHFPGCAIVVRADHRSEKLEGAKMDGPPPPAEARDLEIRENGVRFHVDLRRGHKTGFFVDQRENRARLAGLCRDEDVFDGFCYTGGFALNAALAGAKSVEAVELDEDAVATAEANRALNGLEEGRARFIHGNVFDVLRAHRAAGRTFSRVVLDPAKLAISRAEVPKALSAYADMNRLGIQCLKPGGVLLACSCTGLVSEEDFLMALRAAAGEAGVDLRVFHLAGAAPDHPWAIRMPEGRYLKAIFAQVLPL